MRASTQATMLCQGSYVSVTNSRFEKAATMTGTGRLTAGYALVFATLLPEALARRTCGEVVWQQTFETPSIDEILTEVDGEAFYPVGDPPGCVLATTCPGPHNLRCHSRSGALLVVLHAFGCVPPTRQICILCLGSSVKSYMPTKPEHC